MNPVKTRFFCKIFCIKKMRRQGVWADPMFLKKWFFGMRSRENRMQNGIFFEIFDFLRFFRIFPIFGIRPARSRGFWSPTKFQNFRFSDPMAFLKFFKNRFLGRAAHEKIFLFDEIFFSTTTDWHRCEKFFLFENFFFNRLRCREKIFFEFLKIFKIVFFWKNFFCYRRIFFHRIAHEKIFLIGRAGSKTGPRGSKTDV